ncbi:MAG: type IX secretion system membrane protein PorP/SprF [Bacteroidales bacterium]
MTHGKMKRVIVLVILVLSVLPAVVKAQQIPLYSQYTMNKYLLNPAYAGSQGYTSYNLTARQQWMGFGNAKTPSTQAICAQTRVLQNNLLAKLGLVDRGMSRRRTSGRVGMGGYLFNDRNGIINRTGIQGTYAYHIPVSDRQQLSFGVSGTVYQFKLDDENIKLPDDDLGVPDPLVHGRENSMFVPDATAGIYYMNNNFHIGVSGMNLFQSVLKFGSDQSYSSYQLLRHYYLMTSYQYELDGDITLEPSLLFKTTERKNLQADISMKAYYQGDYWMGLSYRTGSALISKVGVKVDNIYFGYAYDYSLREIQKLTYGSHEIMVGIRFGDSNRRTRFQRRF